MKISLNLALSESLRQRYGLVWAIPVALGALAFLVYSLILAAHDLSEYSLRHRSADNLEAQVTQLRAREVAALRDLQRPEYVRLLTQTTYVNSLIDQKQLSMTELVAKVTRLLSPEVRLTSLQFSQPSGQPFVHLSVESNREQALLDFENKLEESDDFTDVTVAQQGFAQKGSSAAPGISCTAIYVGGRSR